MKNSASATNQAGTEKMKSYKKDNRASVKTTNGNPHRTDRKNKEIRKNLREE